MPISEDLIQRVWEKERAVFDRDPTTWRKDECGAWIRREHYGRTDSEYGWIIDSLIPGGPEDVDNMRALHWQNTHGIAGQRLCRVTGEADTTRNRGAG